MDESVKQAVNECSDSPLVGGVTYRFTRGEVVHHLRKKAERAREEAAKARTMAQDEAALLARAKDKLLSGRATATLRVKSGKALQELVESVKVDPEAALEETAKWMAEESRRNITDYAEGMERRAAEQEYLADHVDNRDEFRLSQRDAFILISDRS